MHGHWLAVSLCVLASRATRRCKPLTWHVVMGSQSPNFYPNVHTGCNHRIRCDCITAAISESLHWLPVQQRIDYKLCVLVYKCLHQGAPVYLSELCIPVASTARSHLRSAAKECLIISYCSTKNYGQRSFSYSGPTLWNSLPLTLRDKSMSLSQFCSRLKTEMFCRDYNRS